MTGFDPDDYGGYDGEEDEYYAIENAYSEANNTSRPISILLDVYKRYEDKDSIADRVANDQEALEWLDDYREYVCDVEHGNEGSIEDMGGFVGFARIFSDNADAVAEYLLYDEYDNIDDDAKNLYDRLKRIASRYGGMSKMKKSDDEYTYGLPDSINIQGIVLDGRNSGISMRYRDDWSNSFVHPTMDVEISHYDDRIMVQYALLYGGGASYSQYRVVDTVDEALALVDGWYTESMATIGKMKKSENDFNDWIHDILYQWEMKSGMKLKRLKIDENQTKSIINRNADQYRQIGDSENVALKKGVIPNAFTNAGVYDRNNLSSVWDFVDLLYDSMRQRFGIDDRQLAEDIAFATLMDEENDEGYTASTKKSIPNIHDMIAQTRANNNSLVKSRVDLNNIKKKE